MITTPVKLWRRGKDVSLIIGQEGKILSFTVIRVAAQGFGKESPYPVVIVKMDNGKKLTGQLVDWTEKDLKKGTRVRAVLRKLTPDHTENIIAYVIKFLPLNS
mgnify:FL=1